MDNQFYPTPSSLARRVWAKFKSREFVRVLDPEAGNGDLVAENPWGGDSRHIYGRKTLPIDGIEIDVTKHGILREKGINVVGTDFLQFSSCAIYSHIIMNPPFAEGAKHVLRAWDLLWDGEIVAIINAETIRNPFSGERQMLASLVERYGEVEFVDGAFAVPDAERKTNVDVALVYLRKQANVKEDIVGHLLDDLQREGDTAKSSAGDFEAHQQLALPNSAIENAVLAFNAAVQAMRDCVFSTARSRYYTGLVGETMAERNGDGQSAKPDGSVEYVQREIGKGYGDIKDRAWSGILRSTNVTSRLSSEAQKRIESVFEQIKQLEFTAPNIYGFLCGLVESQGKIQIEMACDVFDAITRYHSDNTVFYKGWKSNDRHRTCGMRIKGTRFILPRHSTQGWRSNLSWESEQLLADFDKVFAMLDGKVQADVSLVDLFRTHFQKLSRGARLSSSYFDIRYYPGIGTIHFFPTRPALIDRLNRLVGRQRQWLPPEGTRVSNAFWLQFERADKLDKEVRAEVKKGARNRWDDPLHGLFSTYEPDSARPLAVLDKAISTVLGHHGISVDFCVESEEPRVLLAA